MIKKLLLFILLSCYIYADIVDFKEERYIYAVDNSFIRKGTILFEKDKIEVFYKNDSKILIYSNDNLTVKDEDSTYDIDLEKNIHMKIFFNLLEAIYNDEKIKLEEYFNIKIDNNTVFLDPKDLIANYISSISYKKTEKLDFLKIELSNEDRIEIEQIN